MPLLSRRLSAGAAAALAMTALVAPTSRAQAKGCIRGAIVGGVAGHYAHRHTVSGAVAGCVAGHYYYKHKAAKAAAAQR